MEGPDMNNTEGKTEHFKILSLDGGGSCRLMH